MKKVDINSDLGESFGAYTLGLDEEVLKNISSANIACGWHAGDSLVMEKTVRIAKDRNVAVGAHPGYPDLAGFGRRNMGVTPEELKSYIKYQIGALRAFSDSNGMKLQHVKPHGAMYNQAAKDYKLALAIAEGIKEVDSDLILLGLAGSEMIRAGKEIGIKTASEVFADRAYNDDGTLVARNLPGAVIHDKKLAIARTVNMVKTGKTESINGKEIDMEVHSICIHGDNPEAVAFAQEIRAALIREGVEILPIAEIV